MNEEEFIQQIDARFPYGDFEKCKYLIEQGSKFTDNASFMVLHELCRLPKGAKVDRAKLLYLIDHWMLINPHPLSNLVANLGKKILMDIEVPVSASIAAMEKIRPFKGLRCALSIPYFACDDVDGKADKIFNAIEKEWGFG